MEDWISQATILKLIAVFFVLIVVLRRPKIRKTQLILSIPALAAASTFHYLKSGPYGILFCLSGAAAAFIFTLPLYKLKRITDVDLIASCTVGGIIGPAGYSVTFLIAFMLFTLQCLLKVNDHLVSEHFTHFTSFYKPDLTIEGRSSVLTGWATNGILQAGSSEHALNGRTDGNLNENQNGPGMRRVENILPWRSKLALATITVLLIGIPL